MLYCTVADVEEYLTISIVVEGSNPTPNPFNPEAENVTQSDITYFINAASRRIDSSIATQYDTPLKKINQGGVIDYPFPLKDLCAILTAEIIFEKRLQGADRQKSEYQKDREKWAYNELLLIQNGERRLLGIRPTRGSRFVLGTLFDIVKNPAVEHKSRGQGG